MLVRLFLLCYYVTFISSIFIKRPTLAMRPTRGYRGAGAGRYPRGPATRPRRLCGPAPRPGDDCEPSLCSVLSMPGYNPKFHHLTTCVPLRAPSHHLLNNKLNFVPYALRGVVTSSTLGPYDDGRHSSSNPTSVVKCHGLAVCKNLLPGPIKPTPTQEITRPEEELSRSEETTRKEEEITWPEDTTRTEDKISSSGEDEIEEETTQPFLTKSRRTTISYFTIYINNSAVNMSSIREVTDSYEFM